MADIDPHWAYVIVSYVVSALVLVGLAITVVYDSRRQKRLLADLEAAGGRRRSRASVPQGDT